MKTSKSHEGIRVLTDHKGEEEKGKKNIERKDPTKTAKSDEYVRVPRGEEKKEEDKKQRNP